MPYLEERLYFSNDEGKNKLCYFEMLNNVSSKGEIHL